MTIMARYSSERTMPKYSGTVRWKTSASSTPARPAYMEESTKTPARYRATGTPITPAAMRWSRMALRARPGLAAQHAAGEQAAEQEDGEGEVPELLGGFERHGGDEEFGVVEGEPEERQRGHGTAVEAAGERARVEQHVLADEDEREGGDAEVGAAQPASRSG